MLNELSFDSIVDYIVRFYGNKSECEIIDCCRRFQENLGYDAKKLADAVKDRVKQ